MDIRKKKGIVCLVELAYNQEDNDDELSIREQLTNISEALEMLRKLYIFAWLEQPQLYNALFDLESKLTDIYLDSKAVKQTIFPVLDLFIFLLSFDCENNKIVKIPMKLTSCITY